DLRCRADYHVSDWLREESQVPIRHRRGLLYRRHRFHEDGELPQGDAGNGEVLQRAKRLHSVERIVRNLSLPQEILLGAHPHTAEPDGLSTARDGGVYIAQALGDGARSASHECGVELGEVSDKLLELASLERQHLGGFQGASRCSVSIVFQEQPFADRLTRAEGAEAHRSAVAVLLDGHGAAGDYGKEPAFISLGEQERVGRELYRLEG